MSRGKRRGKNGVVMIFAVGRSFREAARPPEPEVVDAGQIVRFALPVQGQGVQQHLQLVAQTRPERRLRSVRQRRLDVSPDRARQRRGGDLRHVVDAQIGMAMLTGRDEFRIAGQMLGQMCAYRLGDLLQLGRRNVQRFAGERESALLKFQMRQVGAKPVALAGAAAFALQAQCRGGRFALGQAKFPAQPVLHR